MKPIAFVRKGDWIGLLMAAGIIVWIIVARGPYYQGKSLAAWADDLPRCYYDDPSPETRAAFVHYGPQAIPLAVRLCQTKDSYLWKKLDKWSEAWNRRFVYWPIHLEMADDAQARGKAIFKMLGPAGAPAIPKLVKLLETDDDDVWTAASSALSDTGANVVPPLIKLLKHPRPRVRARAALGLGGQGAVARIATPDLLHCLADPDVQVRGQAAFALGQVSDDPAVIAPLLRCLQDPQFGHNDYAAAALGNIRKEPEIVVPALLDYLAIQTNELAFHIHIALNRYGTNAQPWAPRLAGMIQTGRFGNMTPLWLHILAKIDPNLAAPMLTAWEQAHPPPPSPPLPPDDNRRGHLPPPPPPSSPTPPPP